MNDVKFYLSLTFGNKIHFVESEIQLPQLLKQDFDFLKFQINGNKREFILVKPKSKIVVNINTLKKQRNQIEKLTMCNSVLVFDELRLSQRNALIQSDFAFIVTDNQIYIPNVIFNLNEKDVVEKEYGSQFSVQAQVLFIYILLNRIEETNARQLSNKLLFPVTSVNRALNELVDRELLYTVGNNTRKIYKWVGKNVFWEKGKVFLFNPVSKIYYLKDEPNDEFLMSNELALSRLSQSLNQCSLSYYATTNKEIENFDTSKFIDRYNLFDDKYCVIEQFKYNPKILSDSNYIDRISLYAQFKDEKDERVQMALDEIVGDILC